MDVKVFDKADPILLAGTIDAAIIRHAPHAFCAWTKTWEGPARPDIVAALADLTATSEGN